MNKVSYNILIIITLCCCSILAQGNTPEPRTIATPLTNIALDSDGDGIPDSEEDYPNDSERSYLIENDPNLLLRYNFDGLTSSTVLDSSANNNHAILNGILPEKAFADDTVNFVSGDGFIATPQINGEFKTIAFWLKSNRRITGTENEPIMNFGDGIEAPLLWQGTSNPYKLEETITINNNGTTAIESSISLGWNHIALVWNGNNYDIYINGTNQETHHKSNVAQLLNNTFIKIGARPLNNDFSNDILDDIRIYSRSLTATELNDMRRDISYTVAFLPGLHGSFSSEPGTQTIDHNQSVTAPDVIPNEGWLFAGWDSDITHIRDFVIIKATYVKQGTSSAHWAFDNPDNLIDSSGSGKHPEAYGEPTFPPAVLNEGLRIQNDTYLNYRLEEERDYTHFSIAIWAKANASDLYAEQSIFNNNSRGSEFEIDMKKGQYRFRGDEYGNFGPTTSEWAHLAIVCDGTETRIYYNGLLADTLPLNVSEFKHLQLGRDRSGNNHFEGTVDEFHFYEYPLTQEEVIKLATINSNIVNFNPGEHGSISSGQTNQIINDSQDATPPNIVADNGWVFTGWDKPHTNIFADVIITAQYSENTPEGGSDDDNDGVQNSDDDFPQDPEKKYRVENDPYLLVRYEFEDLTHNIVTDSSTHKRHAELKGITVQEAQSNGSIDFYAANGYVDTPHIEGDFKTISFWYKPHREVHSDSTSEALIYFGQGDDEAPWIWQAVASSKISDETLTLQNNGFSATTNDLFTEWNHIAFLWNGTNYDIILNGQYTTTIEAENDPAEIINNTLIKIGARPYRQNYCLDQLDDFRLYSRSLTTTEILEITDDKSHNITFSEGDHGFISSGEKRQTVQHNQSAAEPEITPYPGWTFRKWDRQFDIVRDSITITAIYAKSDTPSVHWSFDNPNNLLDSSGNNYHPRAIGEPLFLEGVNHQALKTNEGTYFDYTFKEKTTLNKFTIAIWAKADTIDLPSSSGIFNNNSGGSEIQIDVKQGQYRFRGDLYGYFGPLNTEWTHLAIVCDGENMHLYYNGIQTNTVNLAFSEFKRLQVGTDRYQSKFFSGLVDEFYLFDYPLESDDINRLVNTSSYSVQFDPGEHGSIISGKASQTVFGSKDAKPPVVKAETGWTFNGWDQPFTNISQNLLLTAQYAENSNEGSQDSDGDGVQNSDDDFPQDPERFYTIENDPHLLVRYTFDNIVSNTITDSSANHYHATLVNSSAEEAANLTAIDFSLNDSHVESPTVYGEFRTISFWINPLQEINATTNEPIIEFIGENNSSYLWQGDANTALSNETITIGNESHSTAITQNLSPHWNHLALVWNDTSYDFYLNGELQLTSSTDPTMLIRDSILNIGARLDTNEFCDDQIDDIRIYNRSLTATEITDIHNDTEFIVTFDHGENGYIIGGNKTQKVAPNKDAIPPRVQGTYKWVFSHWDKDYTNITADTLITAQYLPDEDNDGIPNDSDPDNDYHSSIKVTQAASGAVQANDTNKKLLRIDLEGFNNNQLQSVDISLTGHSALSAASLYISRFETIETAQSLQTITEPSDKISFKDINHILLEGESFLWITVDIIDEATPNTIIDADLINIAVDNSTLLSTNSNPDGNLLVQEKSWTFYPINGDAENGSSNLPEDWIPNWFNETPGEDDTENLLWSREHAFTGSRSLKIVNTAPDSGYGSYARLAWQGKRTVLNDPTTYIRFSAWSKAENVAVKDNDYYLLLRVEYEDGKSDWSTNGGSSFNEGTHGWEKSTGHYNFSKNVVAVTPYVCLFKGAGTVWFDDMELSTKSLSTIELPYSAYFDTPLGQDNQWFAVKEDPNTITELNLEEGYDGGALKITNPTDSDTTWRGPTIPVKSGTTSLYTSARSKAEGVSYSGIYYSVRMRVTLIDNTVIWTHSHNTAFSGSSSWNTAGDTFTFSKDIKYVQPILHLRGTDTAWFDELHIVANQTISGLPFVEDFDSGLSTPNNWYPYRDLSINTSNWQEAESLTGKAIGLTNNASGSSSWNGPLINLTVPTKNIRLQAWSKAENLAAFNRSDYFARMRVVLEDGSIIWTFSSDSSFSGSNEWNKIDSTFEFDQNVISIQASLILRNTTGTVYFDDLSITHVTAETIADANAKSSESTPDNDAKVSVPKTQNDNNSISILNSALIGNSKLDPNILLNSLEEDKTIDIMLLTDAGEGILHVELGTQFDTFMIDNTIFTTVSNEEEIEFVSDLETFFDVFYPDITVISVVDVTENQEGSSTPQPPSQEK